VLTANERFKAAGKRRVRWAAVLLAVGIHAGILFLTPSWDVFTGRLSALGPRMVVEMGEWAPPPAHSVPQAAVAYEPRMREPIFANPGEANRLVVKHYPPLLWKHREEGSAIMLLRVNGRGRVTDAEILDSSDNATDEALLLVARGMRFELDETLRASGVVGVVEIAVMRNL
jgi:TonB family protein